MSLHRLAPKNYIKKKHADRQINIEIDRLIRTISAVAQENVSVWQNINTNGPNTKKSTKLLPLLGMTSKQPQTGQQTANEINNKIN